jgi:histidinol-phosphate aminotransferase
MIEAEQVAALIRPDIFEMDAYTPIVPFEVLCERLGLPAEQIVKVDANENPYGPSPRVAEALASYPYYHIYPDPNHTLLREALEQYVGVGREHLMLGTGSDELLDVVIRLFVQPGDAIVDCPPSFGMYPFLASVAGARVVSVSRREDWGIDVPAIEALYGGGAKQGGMAPHLHTDDVEVGHGGHIGAGLSRPPKLIFIASPNNPDGSVLSREDLLRLLALPAVVVVDQAYVEFGGDDLSRLVPEHANLIVMRTFSKWAGLAGLRVGYGVFPAEILGHLFKIKQPYNVNAAAQAAVLASLADVDTLLARVRTLVAERERLYSGLKAIEYLHPYPSHSNFVLNRVLGWEAAELKYALERRGILVRYYRKPRLSNCIRISVGKPEQNERVLAELRALTPEGL